MMIAGSSRRANIFIAHTIVAAMILILLLLPENVPSMIRAPPPIDPRDSARWRRECALHRPEKPGAPAAAAA
jgi:hypothetical protein